jgi:hypothetical protein
VGWLITWPRGSLILFIDRLRCGEDIEEENWFLQYNCDDLTLWDVVV